MNPRGGPLLCQRAYESIGVHSCFRAKPELDTTPMMSDEVDKCRRRVSRMQRLGAN
jgi:hypothetical protein